MAPAPLAPLGNVNKNQLIVVGSLMSKVGLGGGRGGCCTAPLPKKSSSTAAAAASTTRAGNWIELRPPPQSMQHNSKWACVATFKAFTLATPFTCHPVATLTLHTHLHDKLNTLGNHLNPTPPALQGIHLHVALFAVNLQHNSQRTITPCHK